VTCAKIAQPIWLTA